MSCGQTKTEPAAAKGHSWGAWKPVDDIMHSRKCDDCDATDTKAHSWDDGSVSDGLCTEVRYKIYACADCTRNKIENVPATEHSWGAWHSDGNTNHTRDCDNCIATETETHNWGAAVITGVDCVTAGTATYSCTKCTETKAESAPAKGHKWGAWTSDGKTTHTRECEDCSAADTKDHGIIDQACTDCEYAEYTVGLAYSGGTVTGIGTATDTDIIIPSVYKGTKITAINASAFSSGCLNVTSMYIPATVTSMGKMALSGCVNIQSLTLPFVGDGQSHDNVGMAKGPQKLGYIFGDIDYQNNTILNENVVPKSLKSVTLLGGSVPKKAFSGCRYIEKIRLPDGLDTIYENAFYDCRSLTDIEIPSTVKAIGEYAFGVCVNLPTLTVPSSVTTIGANAFNNCTSMTSLYLYGKFSTTVNITGSCAALTIYYPGNYYYGDLLWNRYYPVVGQEKYCPIVFNCDTNKKANTGYCYTVVGGIRYRLSDGVAEMMPNENQPTSLQSMERVTIPGTITYDGETYAVKSVVKQLFYDQSATKGRNTALKSVVIEEGVTSIESYAFSFCDALTDVSLPNSLAVLESELCSSVVTNEYRGGLYLGNDTNKYIALVEVSDKGITSFDIHPDTKAIGCSAFSECVELESVSIPDGVRSIGIAAFSGRKALASIDIPNSVTYIGDSAFYNCVKLTSIDLPNGLTSIGNNAFSNCSGLTSIEIPDGVTSIGNSAFNSCSKLTEIIIPESVKTIGSSVLEYCSGLTSVYYKGDAEKWKAISIASSNGSLTAAARYYYSETQPTDDGNYWHYGDDGVTPEPWTQTTTL